MLHMGAVFIMEENVGLDRIDGDGIETQGDPNGIELRKQVLRVQTLAVFQRWHVSQLEVVNKWH